MPCDVVPSIPFHRDLMQCVTTGASHSLDSWVPDRQLGCLAIEL